MTFNFNIFHCFSNIRNHLSNFSYLVCKICKIFIRWRFYLLLKTENSRRVVESRPVCVGLKTQKMIYRSIFLATTILIGENRPQVCLIARHLDEKSRDCKQSICLIVWLIWTRNEIWFVRNVIDVKISPEYSREYSGFKKLIPKIQKVALSSHIWDTTWETVIALGRKKF
jgi:hypothetical protein